MWCLYNTKGNIIHRRGLLLILKNPKWRTWWNIGVHFLQWWHKVVFLVTHSPIECQALEISARKYSVTIHCKLAFSFTAFYKENISMSYTSPMFKVCARIFVSTRCPTHTKTHEWQSKINMSSVIKSSWAKLNISLTYKISSAALIIHHTTSHCHDNNT